MTVGSSQGGDTVLLPGAEDHRNDVVPEGQPAGAASPPAPPPVRRGRPRWFAPILALIILGLVGALLVLGDTVARRYAEDQVATRIQAELHLAAAPRVEVTGFPFLTQVAGQRFSAVHVTAATADIDLDGRTASLQDVDLWLFDVTSSDNFDHLVVGRLEGSGAATWPAIAAIVEADLRYAGPDDQGRGRMAVSQSLDIQGLRLPITITGRPVIDQQTGQLSLAEPSLAVSGITLPADLVADLLTQRLKPIDLPLPEGLRIADLVAEESGLRIVLHGTDVTLGG